MGKELIIDDSVKEMFAYFPKEIGTPRRIHCETPKDFLSTFVDRNGKVKKLYTSIYDCPDKNYDKCNIHIVGFDLDSESKVENVIKMHNKLMEGNIRHTITFSTNGFWVYVKTKNYEDLKFKKDALTRVQNHIADKCGLAWGNSKVADLDEAIRGDIKRITRMIGSLDVERNRYCIGVTIDDVKKGFYYVCSKSENLEELKLHWYGEEEIDISKFDEKITYKGSSLNHMLDEGIYIGDYDINMTDEEMPKLIQNFMPIVQRWLTLDGGANWEQRFYTTVYLVELGLPDNIVENICRKFFIKNPRKDNLPTNYHHWKVAKVLSQAHKEHQNFPQIETLYSKGLIDKVSLKDYEMFNDLYYQGYNINVVKKQFSDIKRKSVVF